MTGFDDRARRAREDLESAFDDLRAPDFAVLQARQRRRRVAAGGVATVLVLALGIVAVGTLDRDDPERVATVEPTTTPTVAQPTVPPTASSVAPSTTTTPTTVAQPTDSAPTTTTPSTRPVAPIAVSGPEPTTLVAVRDDGALVRLRATTGAVTAVLASKASGGQPTPEGVADATIGADGRIFYERCCTTKSNAVYDVRSKKSQPRLQGTASSAPPSLVGSAAVTSPDGKYLALHDASRIEIYQLATGKRVRTIVSNEPGPTIVHMAMANDGRVAVEVPNAAAAASRAVFEMASDATSMDDVTFRLGFEFVYATAPAYLPDGRLVYAAIMHSEMDNAPPDPTRLHVVSRTGDDVQITPDLPFGVRDLAVSKSGHLLVTGTDHVLRAFDGKAWRDVARGYTAADW